jgi:hypothetical protein
MRVDIPHQRVGVIVRRRLGDPGARADRELALIDRDGARQRFADPFADLNEVALVGHVFEQQPELIGTEPGRRVTAAEGRVEP